MYKWVIVSNKIIKCHPDSVGILSPCWYPLGNRYNLLFSKSTNLEQALRLMPYWEDIRWDLSECLFDTKEQALWYVKARLGLSEEDCQEEGIRPAMYWVDDKVANELAEKLNQDRQSPLNTLLDEYLTELHSNMGENKIGNGGES